MIASPRQFSLCQRWNAHTEAAPAVLQSNDQKHWKEFILLLETLPEIWDSSNVISINKVKRANAYEQLLKIFKKIKPGATIYVYTENDLFKFRIKLVKERR